VIAPRQGTHPFPDSGTNRVRLDRGARAGFMKDARGRVGEAYQPPQADEFAGFA
jgi:hypothetical protein